MDYRIGVGFIKGVFIHPPPPGVGSFGGVDLL